ncbi:MAG TPA: sigma-54-dependent Fis family transcriptional regulator, partial [Flavobacteriaceae bacterium]|nr:sigma-54-dependent Fis family transcriptional regulator [Flavobacteriaceae bacterium]
ADDDNREAQLAAFVDEEETPEAHDVEVMNVSQAYDTNKGAKNGDKYHFAEEIEEEESLSIQDKELELIKKSLEKYDGKRKEAAAELGISERTLYRKIKQYNL